MSSACGGPVQGGSVQDDLVQGGLGRDDPANSNSDSAEFEDAPSTFPGDTMDADQSDIDATGLGDLGEAVELINNNEFHKAEALLKPKAAVSMYHAIGHASIVFLQAVFSMEPDSIELATTTMTDAVTLCNLRRKDRRLIESISSWVFGQRMDNYTTGELQAEVLYAEGNLLLSMLTFLGDESLLSFIRGALKIRSCYSLYKQLFQWLVTCEEEGLAVEPNFATGVRMGIGCFNLFLSLLPARVLRLLEFIGFSGDRQVGLTELTKGAGSGTFRGPMCTSFLLFYHSLAAVVIGIGDMDADHADRLLRPQIEKYPHSLQFLYFKGRVQLMRGCVDEAIVCFEQARDVQNEWPQAYHLLSWELMWCHCFKGEWAAAASLADSLYLNTKWSKATFLYQKACFQLMMRKSGSALLPSEVTPGVSREEMDETMRKIPPLKQRIAGRSLPVEKFAVSKSERYLQGARLPLCGMEVLYAWNAFVLLGQSPPLLRNMLRCTWNELLVIENTKDDNPFYIDDLCVVMLIQGVCFKSLARYDEAERCFEGIIGRSQDIQHDHYTVAAATMELGVLYLRTGNHEMAERRLEAAKTKYTGYHLESRIHFRIHAGQHKLAQLKDAAL